MKHRKRLRCMGSGIIELIALISLFWTIWDCYSTVWITVATKYLSFAPDVTWTVKQTTGAWPLRTFIITAFRRAPAVFWRPISIVTLSMITWVKKTRYLARKQCLGIRQGRVSCSPSPCPSKERVSLVAWIFLPPPPVAPNAVCLYSIQRVVSVLCQQEQNLYGS